MEGVAKRRSQYPKKKQTNLNCHIKSRRDVR